jgi:hypothetical protein
MDGTLKTAPDEWSQVLSVFIQVKDRRFIPIIVAFFGGRKAETYAKFFAGITKWMKTNCNGKSWKPQRLISDFEPAILKSVRELFGKPRYHVMC